MPYRIPALAAIWKQGASALIVLGFVVTSLNAVADPDRAAKFYEDGLARFKKNDVDGAIIQLKNALQQDNKLLAAHVLLGKALLRDGNPPAAEAAFNEALKLGVNRSEVFPVLGRTLLLLGKSRDVIDHIVPDDLPLAAKVEVLSVRGIAYAEIGNMPLSSQSFENARTLDPSSIVPLVAEIPILLSQGQSERARTFAERAVKLAPDNADAWNMYASVAQAALDWQTALERYGKALQFDPQHVDARVARASILLERKRDDEAQRDLDELKRIVPEEARASYLRAVLAGRKGKTGEVKEALKGIVDVVDALPPAWIRTREQFLMLGGVAHHGLGQFAKAKAYLEAVVNLNSRNIGARRLLASIYLDEKDYGSTERTLDPVLRDFPNDAQALYLMGQLRLAQKRYVQASQLLDRASQAGGDTAEVRAAIGFTQLGLGEGDAGVKSLEAAFARKPDDAKVGLALAMQYLSQGQGAKAIAVIDAVAKGSPENLATGNVQGAVHAAAGDRAGARKAYNQVLARDPLFTPTILNLAKLDQAEGRIDDARKRLMTLLGKAKEDDNAMFEMGLLEQASGRAGEAQRWYERAFQARSTNVRAGLALVDQLLATGTNQRALQIARDLVDANRGNIDAQAALARAQLANNERNNLLITLKDMTKQAEYDPVLQVRIGRMQLMANNPDGAAYNAQKSLTTAPNNLAAMSLMGDAELSRREAAKAEAIARDIITRYPSSPEGFRIAGDAAVARGNYAAAAVSYRGAQERGPGTIAVQRVAHALLLAGESGKAMEALNTWLAKNPADYGARAALAEANMRSGNWKVAREHFDKILAVRPNDAGIVNNQASVLQRLKDPGAMAMAERAYKLAPQDPNVIDTFGWSQASSGKLDPALRLLRDARLRQPENLDVRYHLAWTLAKLGRKAEAREELAYALKPGAKFESLEEAKLLMKELGG